MRVVEIFPSIQGEGIQIGMPMTFIRTVGCNLSCNFCDTKYALNRDIDEDKTVQKIYYEILDHNLDWVCITGGEPLIQDPFLLCELFTMLKDEGFNITVETNGTIVPSLALRDKVDLWTASPKIGHWNPEALTAMKPLQLKIVILEGMLLDIEKWRSVDPKYIVFQPCALTPFNVDINRKRLRSIAAMVTRQKWNDVRVLPQMHKYMWGDKRRR